MTVFVAVFCLVCISMRVRNHMERRLERGKRQSKFVSATNSYMHACARVRSDDGGAATNMHKTDMTNDMRSSVYSPFSGSNNTTPPSAGSAKPKMQQNRLTKYIRVCVCVQTVLNWIIWYQLENIDHVNIALTIKGDTRACFLQFHNVKICARFSWPLRYFGSHIKLRCQAN